MDVVEDELSTTRSDVVNSTSNRFDDIVELDTSFRNQVPVFLDVGGESDGDMELVRVRRGSDERSLRVGDGSELLDRSSS